MRLALALVIALAIAVAVVVAARDDEPSTDLGAVTLVGDSLNVGTDPYLREDLNGWKDRCTRPCRSHDGRGGRGAPHLWASALAPVVVVSLGTNDADGSEDEFRALVADVLRLVGPGRCVVWATIVRDGKPRDGFNDVLEEAAAAHPQLRLLDWATLVDQDESLLAGDLVHGTPDGYERRAEETARIVRTCPE